MGALLIRAVTTAVVFAALVGCGGSDPGTAPADMVVGKDLVVFSVCGHPGDTGNSLGVGKYCQKLTDCTSNTKATLCSTLGSDNAFFCTMTCTPPANDMGSTECGENAYCQCGSGSGQSGCGCFPNSCQ
jgi:hypothetical protein